MDTLLEFANMQQDVFGGGKGYGSVVVDSDAIIPFDAQSAVDLPAVAAAEVVVTEVVVPAGYDGYITDVANVFLGGGFDPVAENIIWRILQDGRPIRNFERITAQKGSLETPRPINPIRVFERQTIQFTVYHASNVGLNGAVVCNLGGYFSPMKR